MGLMVDTNVFIHFEKNRKPLDFSAWDASEKVYISVVVVSELLMDRSLGFHDCGGAPTCRDSLGTRDEGPSDRSTRFDHRRDGSLP